MSELCVWEGVGGGDSICWMIGGRWFKICGNDILWWLLASLARYCKRIQLTSAGVAGGRCIKGIGALRLG